MRFIGFLGIVAGTFLLASAQANAQRGLPPVSAGPIAAPISSVIGPDGTYYALVPGSTSTAKAPVTQLTAISVTGATKWNANIEGEVGQVLAGLNDVYIVQTTTSGSGRNTSLTTSLLVINTSSGQAEKFSPITPVGNISDIQIRTVGSDDYLYIYSISTTSSTSGGTTTYTTTQALSIYQNGALVKTVSL